MQKTTIAAALICGALISPWTAFAQDQDGSDAADPADDVAGEAAEDATEAAPEAAPDAAAEEAADENPVRDYDRTTVLATVNGTDITVGHLVLLRQKLPAQYNSVPDEVLFEGILEQLIDQYLLAETMPEDDALDPAIRYALDNERRAILASNKIGEIAEQEIPEADIEALYDEQFGDVAPQTEVNASHILVATEQEAQALIEELEGGADFAELAKEHSTGPSGPNGGELGWFTRGQMVPEFEDAVFALETGAVSAPVQTQFGWHVITLNETRDLPPPSLEETRDQLIGQLRQQAVEAEVARLREAAEVEMKDEGIPMSAVSDFSVLGN